MEKPTIKLIREATTVNNNAVCYKNWPIRITAESTIPDLDSNIFVYHAADPNDPIQGDEFSNVASLQDMESLPVGAPTHVDGDLTENYVPFYRTNSVALDCHNLVEMERVWSVIKRDTSTLVHEYKASLTLKESETYLA